METPNNPACTKSVRILRMLKLDTMQKWKIPIYHAHIWINFELNFFFKCYSIYLLFNNFFFILELKTQLAEASERGDADAIHHILESGRLMPDVTVNREGFDKSPLGLACMYGQTSVVEELIKVSHFLGGHGFVSSCGQACWGYEFVSCYSWV